MWQKSRPARSPPRNSGMFGREVLFRTSGGRPHATARSRARSVRDYRQQRRARLYSLEPRIRKTVGRVWRGGTTSAARTNCNEAPGHRTGYRECSGVLCLRPGWLYQRPGVPGRRRKISRPKPNRISARLITACKAGRLKEAPEYACVGRHCRRSGSLTERLARSDAERQELSEEIAERDAAKRVFSRIRRRQQQADDAADALTRSYEQKQTLQPPSRRRCAGSANYSRTRSSNAGRRTRARTTLGRATSKPQILLNDATLRAIET